MPWATSLDFSEPPPQLSPSLVRGLGCRMGLTREQHAPC